MAVKKGSKNIQKAALYAFRIKESGCIDSCLMKASLLDFSLSHANRMDVWNSMTIQKSTPMIASHIKPLFSIHTKLEKA
jgi:hypothetical protein